MIDYRRILDTVFTNTPPEPSWQWARENVDYSRTEKYDTPYRGPFDPELMPFWKRPLEDMRDRDCREVVILKCSRAGYSENLVLTDLRYTIAREPERTMYVTGKMELAKGFLDERVIRGMDLSLETKREYKKGKAVGQNISFPRMDFRATWASSDTSTKQDGWKRLYCDEFSLFDGFSVDAYRRRCSAYTFHHILFGSSLNYERRGDPEQDPALLLYNESNACIWKMPDPAGGEFHWNLDGIKIPEECKIDDIWDLDLVAATAYYETPNGTKITEKERMKYTRAGRWQDTKEGIRRGYKVVAPMIPFSDCSFGEIAKKFISAKYRMDQNAKRQDRNRNTLRTYFAEYWAEAHREKEQQATSDKLAHCEKDYQIGNIWVPTGWKSGVFATCDVQKAHIWWLCRNWAMGPEGQWESALVDYGAAPSFPDLDATLADYSPRQVGIDIGYALRATEVADYCAEYTDANPKNSAVMALSGQENQKVAVLLPNIRDAMEGRGGGRAPFLELSWATDPVRTWLMDSIDAGTDWHIPGDWPDPRHQREYVKQVTSTKKVDGVWVAPGHKQDHLFDCEVMQLVLARWDKII